MNQQNYDWNVHIITLRLLNEVQFYKLPVNDITNKFHS
jgi:hypothetical protein